MPSVRVLLLAAAAAAVGTVPAQAKFRVCNKTDQPVAIAIGYFQGRGWASEGWWKVDAKGCADVLQGVLTARYYYLRGVHLGAGDAWEDNRFFCVAPGNFTIKGRQNCKKRGFGQAGFFEIDTLERTTWVQNLSD